jgi:hypothetical protein
MQSLRVRELSQTQETVSSSALSKRVGTGFHGQTDDRQGGFKEYFIASALAVLSAGSLSTAGTPLNQGSIPVRESKGVDSSSDFAGILKRFEQVIFSHSAIVSEIDHSVSGHPRTVTLLVSVDGRGMVVKCPIQDFKFEVRPNMRIMVDGVLRGKVKQLRFRTVQPLRLDSEHENLLASVVSSFKPI